MRACVAAPIHPNYSCGPKPSNAASRGCKDESPDLFFCLFVVCRREDIRNTQRESRFSVHLACEMRAVIGQKIFRCSVLKDSVLCERFVDVEAGGVLQRNDLGELRETIVHEQDESIASFSLWQPTQ